MIDDRFDGDKGPGSGAAIQLLLGSCRREGTMDRSRVAASGR